jgi:hypothetical protein
MGIRTGIFGVVVAWAVLALPAHAEGTASLAEAQRLRG